MKPYCFTPAHEKHLSQIKRMASRAIDAKYRAGAREHRTKLWEQSGILDMAIDEAVDLVVYMLTLREQARAYAREKMKCRKY